MILALDIETIPIPEAIDLAEIPPAPANWKDPAKIAEHQNNARAKVAEKLALDPLTGRVVCVGWAWRAGEDTDIETTVDMIQQPVGDDTERALLVETFTKLAAEDARFVTFNGTGFDLPFIYRRAMILGVYPIRFGAACLSKLTARYSNDLHFDMMTRWTGGGGHDYISLDKLALAVLGKKKTDVDNTKIAAMLEDEPLRAELAAYCANDTILTYEIFERALGCLFV